MTDNGFGYVTIEDNRVKVVSGDSGNPTVQYFENEEFVNAVKFYEKCKNEYPHLWKYTLQLIQNQRTDQDKINEQIVQLIKEARDTTLQKELTCLSGYDTDNLFGKIQKLLEEKS